MAYSSDITIDFNNMMADFVGPAGIQSAEIEDLQPQIRQAFRGLSDLRKLGQLPFRDLPYQEEVLEKMKRQAERIRERCEAVLLLGTGGSSLGATCLLQALRSSKPKDLRIEVCEDLYALNWSRLASSLPPEKTFLIVVSKSGKTTETLASFLFFRQWLIEHIGEVGYRRNVLFITDPKQGPLRQVAETEKIETLPVPPGVGGRYSVLSTVGLLPLACVGVDTAALLAGARRMDERCNKEDVWINPGSMLAALHFLSDRKRDRGNRVLMPYDDRLKGYTEWFAQLWGESLGKLLSLRGKEVHNGSTPIKALGSIDQHSQLQLYLEGPQDKTVTFISVEDPPNSIKIPEAYRHQAEFAPLLGKSVHQLLNFQRQATEAALSRSGCPNLTIRLKELSPHAMGQLLYLAEVETVFAGALYDINPFDQPGVETIKKFIKGLLGVRGFEEYAQALEGQRKDPRYMI